MADIEEKKSLTNTRGFLDLIHRAEVEKEKPENFFKRALPEFQVLDFTGLSIPPYKVKEIILDQHACYEHRKLYPYRYKRGGEQGLRTCIRKLSHRERLPYSIPDLVVKNGRRLYVTIRCAICGSQKRIVITERNQGRETPICKHLNTEQEHKHRSQIYYVKSVKRQKAVNS